MRKNNQGFLRMRRSFKFLIYTILLFSGVSIYSAYAAYSSAYSPAPASQAPSRETPAKKDSVQTHFPITKTSPEKYEDIGKESPADLKTPSNVKTVVEYDPTTNCYVMRTKVGDTEIATPFMLSAD